MRRHSGVPVLLETKARSNSAGWGKTRHGAVHGYKEVKLAQYFESRSLRKTVSACSQGPRGKSDIINQGDPLPKSTLKTRVTTNPTSKT